MLENCDFCELTGGILQENNGFSCKDAEITEFFTKDYAEYAYQLLGKSYCFVEPDARRIVCAFTVANSSIKVDLLPKNKRNKLNRNIPNEKRRPQYPAVLVGQLAVSDIYQGQQIGDELNDFKFLFATDEEEWTFLHGDRYDDTTQGEIPPMRTRLMYFDLILLKT